MLYLALSTSSVSHEYTATQQRSKTMRNWVLAKLSTDTQDSDASHLLSVYKQGSGYTQEYIELELESLTPPSDVLLGLRAIKQDMERLDSEQGSVTRLV